jgi:ABC-type polysaccharide/polyol phosphate transport system ATPase subunit
MARNAIEVEHLSKRYFLGEHHGGRGTLKDAVAGSVRRLLRRESRRALEELWSLQDVSLVAREGEAIGLVGRNGAGKSTLLRIISRITEPTSGTVRTRGRVGALLEVGTGFHPELTGRENVYLNGAILGIRRREIDKRFDEIVDFAGVERFLDTPVKRYSSGMYLRLAFAVAAHLDADIMVVDEVLAVGDAEFQRKCLGKMSALGRDGKTVIFVSHNLGAITTLCRAAVWLDQGIVKAQGAAAEIVEAYVASGLSLADSKIFPDDRESAVSLRMAKVHDDSGQAHAVLRRDRPFVIEVRFSVRKPVPDLDLSVFVDDLRGVRVLDEAWSERDRAGRGSPGEYVARVTVPAILTAGDYTVGFWLGSPYETLVYEDVALGFRLEGDAMGRPNRVVQLSLPLEVRAVEQAGAGDQVNTPGKGKRS